MDSEVTIVWSIFDGLYYFMVGAGIEAGRVNRKGNCWLVKKCMGVQLVGGGKFAENHKMGVVIRWG